MKLINYLEACERLVCVCGRKFQLTFSEILCVPPTHPQDIFTSYNFPLVQLWWAARLQQLCLRRNQRCFVWRRECSRPEPDREEEPLQHTVSQVWHIQILHQSCFPPLVWRHYPTLPECEREYSRDEQVIRNCPQRERGGRKWVVKCPPSPL